MQLELELREAIAALKGMAPSALGGRTAISLGSGCDLFMKYVSRAFLEYTVRNHLSTQVWTETSYRYRCRSSVYARRSWCGAASTWL